MPGDFAHNGQVCFDAAHSVPRLPDGDYVGIKAVGGHLLGTNGAGKEWLYLEIVDGPSNVGEHVNVWRTTNTEAVNAEENEQSLP
jgi:hypothetical protein